MKQKVALVLSGGGARGIAHIGVIEELEKQGFEITSIAGASMGALVGGLHALGTLGVYTEWLCALDKMKMFRLVDFSFRGQGLVKGEKLFNKLHEFIEDALIEDLKIPYAAVAADIINKKEVVFANGSLLDAIRASIAIPTILSPVKTKDGLLVDGGVVNNLPIDHVTRTPGDILVAVNVNAEIPAEKLLLNGNGAATKQSVYQEKMRGFYDYLHKINPLAREEKFGYFEILNKTISLINYRNCQLSLEKYSPDILVNVSHECCASYDFYKGNEVIEIGRRAAVRALEVYSNVS
jgi:NTE family protein